MPGLLLGITWSKTPDIVFTYNNMEIARIKFIIGKSSKGKCVQIKAKSFIKISRDYSKPINNNS